ncbi:MAG: glycosyltransferase family 2 protein [Hasllibacter sp.]
MKAAAVTCVKNEGPFLLEWIAWNRTLGIEGHLFYSNDCDDGTDALLDALQAHGVVTHLPNPAEGRNYQMEALKAAAHHPVVTGAEWVWIADVDEFLNIHAGDGTLADLIDACGDPAAISVTFQFMANGGVERFEDRPVVEQFTMTHDPDVWNGETAQEVKTLVRADLPLKYYGAHRPFLKDRRVRVDPPDWTDGAGREVPFKFRAAANKRRIRKFPAKGARAHATLNHYALRSLGSYLVKNDRGDVNRENRTFDDTYWRERNDAAREDRSILRHLPRLRAEIARLKALDGIAALHDACVAAHRAKEERLMTDWADLADRLRAAPTIPPAELALIEELAL